MDFITMTPNEAIRTFAAAGLLARIAPTKVGNDLTVFGDPHDPAAAIQCYQWACGVFERERDWLVCLSAYTDDAEFPVSTLEDAVSLALFAFAHRKVGGHATIPEEIQHAQRTFAKWRTQSDQ